MKLSEQENNYISFNDNTTPNHYIGRKNEKKIVSLKKIEILYKSFQLFYPIYIETQN